MRVFFRLVVRQIVLYGLSYVENPYACYYFMLWKWEEKSAVKPKTGGFVLSSSSELGPGSGRSQATLQNL